MVCPRLRSALLYSVMSVNHVMFECAQRTAVCTRSVVTSLIRKMKIAVGEKMSKSISTSVHQGACFVS